ncbi:MAG: hypothetical protein ACQERU_10015 [Bacteroidota bacterium]
MYFDDKYHRSLVRINEEIALLCNFYYDDAVNGEKQQSYISIFENGNFLKYLLLAPINYYFKNGKESPKQLAYKLQLKRITHWASSEEYKYWENYFNQIDKKFFGCELDGFSLQGD